jgi:LCP family protein required for cell wall assembly
VLDPASETSKPGVPNDWLAGDLGAQVTDTKPAARMANLTERLRRVFGGRSADGGSTSPMARSRTIAALLSFVWPGLGQLYVRRFLMAAVFAVPTLLALIWLAFQLANGLDWFSLSLLDSSFALTLMIGAVVLGLWRLIAMAHAYATAGPLRRPRPLEVGVLAALLVVVIAVHAEASYYAWSFFDFDTSIAAAAETPNPTSTSTASPAPSLPTWQPGDSAAVPTPIPVPSQTLPPSHHMTILLAGKDWMPGRTTAMYDALMVVSLDTQTRKVVMVSVPRDTAYFDYYWGGRTGVNTKINNFATLVERRQIPAPDPPFIALSNEIGYLVGIKVDYYAVLDMVNFGALVDTMGGVCVYNPKSISDPSIGAFFAAGNICLNGKQSILYARSRHGGGNDYVRAGRQQALITALAKKVASPGGVAKLPAMLRLAKTVVTTNFPLNTAKDYVDLVRSIGSGDITNCVLGPPYNYHPATSLSRGAWTTRLKLYEVANLSVYLFGTDSRYYGMEGIKPAPCP